VLDRVEDEPTALIFLNDIYAKAAEPASLAALWEKLDPERLDAATRELVSLRAADAYSALGNSAAAIALYERLSASPRQEIAVAALQQLLAEARKADDDSAVAAVVIKAENALRPEPDQLAEFWLRVGAGAFRDGKLDLARSYFQRISALLPPERVKPDVPIYLAEIAARQGDVAGAVELLRAALPFAGASAALTGTRLGWYQLRLERWADAHSTLAAALPAAAGDAELYRLASAYDAYVLYRGDLAPDALAALDRGGAVALAGLDRLRAELLRRVGRTADALAGLEAVIAARPADLEARVARLALLFENGRYERVGQAAAELDAAAVAPDDAGLRAAAAYLAGVAAAASGDFAAALRRLDAALSPGGKAAPASLGPAGNWALFYRGWTLYRLARFAEAKAAFDVFLAAAPQHERAYSAVYLSAWCLANTGDYRAAAAAARRAADLASVVPSADAAELAARAAYLEGTLRPFLSDWDGALAALDRAVAARSTVRADGLTSYTVRAAFERGSVLDAAGRIDAADAAFALVSQRYARDPLAEAADYRRGELMYRAKRWADAAERFAAYRQTYPLGASADAALYFGGLALKADGKPDAGILLWERLVADFGVSRYRFPAFFALGRTYKEKRDWQGAFRAYTTVLAEFAELARQAGAADEAEILRYLMTGLPEKAAQLHAALTKQGGAVAPAGRRTGLQLARFYINESAQKEAGAALLDEVLVYRATDPAAAGEALLLRGDYFAQLGNYEKAALAYLDAVDVMSNLPAAALSTQGASLRLELTPEALFKAAQARYRSGLVDSALETAQLLFKAFPDSTWTAQGRRLLEEKQ
jgi:outer membrane protein assembly factor BamD (BamD/ComL family)